jgi:hypothetical protein
MKLVDIIDPLINTTTSSSSSSTTTTTPQYRIGHLLFAVDINHGVLFKLPILPISNDRFYYIPMPSHLGQDSSSLNSTQYYSSYYQQNSDQLISDPDAVIKVLLGLHKVHGFNIELQSRYNPYHHHQYHHHHHHHQRNHNWQHGQHDHHHFINPTHIGWCSCLSGMESSHPSTWSTSFPSTTTPASYRIHIPLCSTSSSRSHLACIQSISVSINPSQPMHCLHGCASSLS